MTGWTFTDGESQGSVKATLMEALMVATGVLLARIEDGVVQWQYDASDALRLFARQCAIDVIDRWAVPHSVWRYLKSGDESLRAAAFVDATHAIAPCEPDATVDPEWEAQSTARLSAMFAMTKQGTANNADNASRYAIMSTSYATGIDTYTGAVESMRDRHERRLRALLASKRAS